MGANSQANAVEPEHKHRALVVESDLACASELAEALAVLGLESMDTDNGANALRLVRRTNFCLVLMGLRLKATTSSCASRVDNGRVLVKQLRKRFPYRTEDLAHRTQILVIGTQQTPRHEILRLMRLGADDVLVKPLNDNEPPVEECIQQALVRSGRVFNDECLRDLAPPEHACPSSRGDRMIDVAAAIRPANDSDGGAEAALTIDVRKQTVEFHGVEIPTTPQDGTRHLQKQPLAVLTALAHHPGEYLTSAKLDEFLFNHRLLDDKLGENLSSIRSRITGPFRDALAGIVEGEEIANLIQVSRDKIRLRLDGPIRIVGLTA